MMTETIDVNRNTYEEGGGLKTPLCEACETCPIRKGSELPHRHNSNTEYMLQCEPDEDTFMSSAEIFKLISDATRLKILWLLCHSEDCVINIAAAMNMTSPAVSHHLKTLKSAGLISSRRDGKETYYTLAQNSEAQFVHDIIDRTFNIKCR